ncbi:MAG: isoprenylcysteine carboxylmethyltransferase family protein [Hyphomicrobium sp.]
MLARVEMQEPVVELKGALNRIDLSAWISGASFAIGMMLASSPQMARSILTGGPGLYVPVAAFLLFLGCVLAIQRHMRLSLLANTFGEPRRLVTSGIFRYSRNPIYVAFFLPLASIAVFSVSAAIAAAAIYILAMNLTVIRKEERDLMAAFGEDYAHYLSCVPRWLI